MKKIFLILSLFMLSIIPVQAQEYPATSRLYFTEDNNRLYYESSFIDEDVFMKHLDMVPGSSYTDELEIENGTKTDYTLYFQVKPIKQSADADELLENIQMTIKLDDKVIYNGKATGLDYNNDGINIQNTILIGRIKPSNKSKMVVETTLSKDYDNTNLNELSYIDWSFYAQYGDEITEIIESPNTMKNSFPYTIVFSIIIISIGLVVTLNAVKKKN